ncbi:MAG: ATP-binding protein, partial [Nanoarchaeota archaeon]
MEIKALKDIIEKGESVDLELKRSFHSSQEIAKTICSFANTQGGVLILGVEDNKKISGLCEDMDQLQKRISDANSTVHPKPIMNIEIHEVEGKKVATLIVHRADSSVFHSFEGAIYVRIGTTTQKLEGNSI